MTTYILLAGLLAVSGVLATGTDTLEKVQAEAPEHQVVAIYFHRTVRCPTCKRIGSLAEQAITKGFADEVKSGAVEFQFVDFQDKANAKLAKQFDIDSPTLVLQNVFEKDTVCWTTLPKVWQLFGKPKSFEAYVHEGVSHYLQQTKEEAAKEQRDSKEPAK